MEKNIKILMILLLQKVKRNFRIFYIGKYRIWYLWFNKTGSDKMINYILG